jgi:hypothetical protein
LVALVKLQKDRPVAVKLADALVISQSGPRMLATFSFPANDLVELMKAAVARRATVTTQSQP